MSDTVQNYSPPLVQRTRHQPSCRVAIPIGDEKDLSETPHEIAPEWRAKGVVVTRPRSAVTACRINTAEHSILFGHG